MRSAEATNTILTVFGLTQPGFKPTIYCTWSWGKHKNHYTTYLVDTND